MFPVTSAEFTAEGTANILVNQHIPLRRCPRTTRLDNGLHFCFNLSQAVYQLLGVHNLATSSYYPNCNEGVERVDHIVAQMLAMVGRSDKTIGTCIRPTSNSLTTISQRGDRSGD